MSIQPTPVLEIAVFAVRAPDAFPAIQHRTHDALATLRGHRASLPQAPALGLRDRRAHDAQPR